MPMTPQMAYLVVLALLLCPVAAWAEAPANDARQWLERMIEAARTLNYEGTFVYVQGQHLEAMRIIHSNGPEGERQRMFSLNGSPREVVVQDNKVTCYFSTQRVVYGGPGYNRAPFPISLPRELSHLEGYYRFEGLGDDRVAERETRVIAIRPRDDLRFGYRLWLDQATGMVLRMALMDLDDGVIEQLMFTDLQVKPEIDPSLLVPAKSMQEEAITVHAPSAGEPIVRSRWQVSELPRGFAEVVHNRFAQPAHRHDTEHIVISDGLATVSVFLERLDGGEPLFTGASRMGAMNAFGRLIEGHQAIVVGEAPPKTIERIADSLRYLPEASPE